MTIKYTPRDFGGFPCSGDADSVCKSIAVARKKAEEGKSVARWEEYLCARFDEWVAWGDKRHTVVKPKGGRVSFVPGHRLGGKLLFEQPELTFTFEQILQTSIPLRALFNDGYDTARAAEELLRACHYRALVNQQEAPARHEQPEKYLATVSFEEGIQHITGNQRDDRAKERFFELVELEQAEAVFSGMFPTPGCFCDPQYPERVEALLEGLRPPVTPPAAEAERYQCEGFTLDEVERLTLARNWHIETGWIKGKPVTKSFAEKSVSNEEKACVAEGDRNPSKADTPTKKMDGPGKKSHEASVSIRQRRPK